ncbi:MAG TPA: GntR family transcriptional regulator, partial [Xanthobacteraceae bacterium]
MPRLALPRLRGEPDARRVESLTEQAYRVVEEQIVTLQLKPGGILSEQSLSATTKFGRTPIREALQRLAREGLITILPRKGILVSDINPRNQLLLLEVRRELERLLSRTGAERATPVQRTGFQDIARGMDRAAKHKDDIAFMRLDRELNALVIEAAHNDYAARSMRLLQGLSRRFWYMHYREAADLP